MAREMKDSGIPWVGKIPEEWVIYRNKILFSHSKEIVGSKSASTQLLSLTTQGIKKKNQADTAGKVPESFDTYQLVYPDDIVMCLFDLDCSAVFSGISHEFGMISPAYKIIKCNEMILPVYADYWFKFVFADRKYMGYAKNLRCTLNYDEFAALLSVVPPIYKQRKIVQFLDSLCYKIDSAIEKTRASIEEYKKLKQAIITQAVTKGIRGDRPMKESGIEWIGTIPSNWELIPFRRLLKERQEKNVPIKSTERLSLSIDLGVTLYSEKTTNLDRFKDDFEQYKLAHEGDLVMNSMNMIVGATGMSNYFGCVSPAYYTFYDELPDHATTQFCEYVFRSKTMLRVLFSLGKGIYAIVRGDDRVNTCRLKVSKDDLKSIVIPVPPLDELREINVYLKAKSDAIDQLIRKKEKLLSQLESYKKSLIYEYVTGKKEVNK